MPTVHREPAPAKLTRSLLVRGVRADGYHLIEAEMVTLGLTDTLEISDAPTASLQVVDEVAWVGAPDGPAQDVPADGSNLVLRALDLVGRRASVRLTKRIPAAAGLGGGSADAAAVLRWAGVSDAAVGARLGADVPFCVTGGRAMVTGTGEVVSPLQPVSLSVVLVTPGLPVSTALVYKAWDALGGPAGDGPNDLEAPAIQVEPRLAWWRSLLASVAGRAPVLAGSGATWFFECPDAPAASLLADDLQRAVVESGERAMVLATEAG
jgi:4-diphosphocytidyl-2-C-methyl-D-erythritol kinase